MNRIQELRNKGLQQEHYIPEKRTSIATRFWLEKDLQTFLTSGGPNRDPIDIGKEIEIVILGHAYILTVWNDEKKVIYESTCYTNPKTQKVRDVKNLDDRWEFPSMLKCDFDTDSWTEMPVIFCLRSGSEGIWQLKEGGFAPNGFFEYFRSLKEKGITPNTAVSKIKALEYTLNNGHEAVGVSMEYVRDVAEDALDYIVESQFNLEKWLKGQFKSAGGEAETEQPASQQTPNIPFTSTGAAPQITTDKTSPPAGTFDSDEIPF